MKQIRALVLTVACGTLVGCTKTTERAPATPESVRTVEAAAHETEKTQPGVPLPLDEAQRLHVLSRLTFGATADSLSHLEELGFEAWFDEQLSDAPRSSIELERALKPYQLAIGPPTKVAERYQYETPPKRVEQARRSNKSALEVSLRNTNLRKVLLDFQMVELSRHMLSPLQLREVMVDFWTNHFNVYARRQRMPLSVPDYLDNAIRPHALGRFEDLLLATAHHPAMLQYLDNVHSRSPSEQKSKGLNENYARELLELHTLGVDAGYSQDDVRSAAHILTGWSMETSAEGGLDFMFREGWHSSGPKTVFGKTFSATGVRQGEDMLRWLASHPATAKNVTTKLCMRFVADSPPPECIATASKAFLSSSGDIVQVLRSIVEHPSFWQPENIGSQIKSPLDFALSAIRVLGAHPDGSTILPRQMAVLGEAPLLEPLPTGYSKRTEAWATTDNMMQRFRFATRIAAGQAGVVLPAKELVPSGGSKENFVSGVQAQFPFLRTSPQKAEELLDALVELDEHPRKRQILAISLVLSSAEFQRR